MGKDLKYAILIDLKGNAAKGIRDLGKEMDALGKRGPAFGGFAQMFGGGVGGRIAGALATRPGGIGGMLSDVIKGATSLALVPVRILSSFAGLIPGIGGIFSSIVGTAANILQGLIGIVANIVGGILNAFAALVGKVAEIMGKVVGTLAKIGLGIGAGIGVALVKGIVGNLNEMQIKAVLTRRLGAGMQAAWKEIERMRGASPFSEEQLAEAVAVLARADLRHPEQYLQIMADTAIGLRISLTEVADLFVQITARGEDLGRARMRLFALGIPKEQVDLIKSLGDLIEILRKRVGGLAAETAQLSPFRKIWEEVEEDLESLTESLTKALIPALERLRRLIASIRENAKFQELATELGGLGQKIIDGLEKAWNWLNTREWSWESLKRGFRQVWTEVLPALWQTMTAGFDWVIAYVKGAFQKLWVEVGQDLANELARVMVGIGAKMQMGAAQKAGMFTRMRRWGGLGVPGGGHEGFFGGFADIGAVLLGTLGKGILGEKMGAAGAAEFKAGQAIAGIGERMFGLARTDAEKAEVLRGIDQKMARAAAALEAAAGRLGGAVAGAAGEAFAGMPQERGIPAIPALAPNVEVAGLRQAIATNTAAAAALQRAGYTEKAAALRAETAAMSAVLTDVVNRLIDGQIQHTDDIRSIRVILEDMRRRLRNLGTAR